MARALPRRHGPLRLPIDDDGELVGLPEQQAASRRAVKLRDAGLSLRTIAGAMQGEGFGMSHLLV